MAFFHLPDTAPCQAVRLHRCVPHNRHGFCTCFSYQTICLATLHLAGNSHPRGACAAQSPVHRQKQHLGAQHLASLCACTDACRKPITASAHALGANTVFGHLHLAGNPRPLGACAAQSNTWALSTLSACAHVRVRAARPIQLLHMLQVPSNMFGHFAPCRQPAPPGCLYSTKLSPGRSAPCQPVCMYGCVPHAQHSFCTCFRCQKTCLITWRLAGQPAPPGCLCSAKPACARLPEVTAGRSGSLSACAHVRVRAPPNTASAHD
jgi:hypothetical protein